MSKCLDKTGVQYLWNKMKNYIASHSGGISQPINVGRNTNIAEGTVITPSSVKTFLMVYIVVSDNRTSVLVPISITGQYQQAVFWMNGHDVIVAFTWNGTNITVNRIAKEGAWASYPVTMSVYTF